MSWRASITPLAHPGCGRQGRGQLGAPRCPEPLGVQQRATAVANARPCPPWEVAPTGCCAPTCPACSQQHLALWLPSEACAPEG